MGAGGHSPLAGQHSRSWVERTRLCRGPLSSRRPEAGHRLSGPDTPPSPTPLIWHIPAEPLLALSASAALAQTPRPYGEPKVGCPAGGGMAYGSYMNNEGKGWDTLSAPRALPALASGLTRVRKGLAALKLINECGLDSSSGLRPPGPRGEGGRNLRNCINFIFIRKIHV